MRLQSHSDILPPLFEDIARQLFSLLIEPSEVGAALREKIAVEGETLDELLKEWVTALLDLLKVQKMVFAGFKILELKTPPNSPYTLRAEALGELLDLSRHSIKRDPFRIQCGSAHLYKETTYHAEILLSETGTEEASRTS